LLKGLTVKAGKKKKSKLAFKAKTDGSYFVHVKSPEGFLGAYELSTSAKAKKSSKPSTKILKIGKDGTASKVLTAVAGTMLTLEAKALKGAPPLATLVLRAPSGDALALQSFLSTSGESLFVTDLPLES